jgi:hypothetical protein
MDRGDSSAGIVGDAAGDDRGVDVLGLEPHYEVADVEGDVDQQQVGTLAAAQHAHRLLVILCVGHGGAVLHRDLGGGGELALQCANDEKPHVSLLSVCARCRASFPAIALRHDPEKCAAVFRRDHAQND